MKIDFSEDAEAPQLNQLGVVSVLAHKMIEAAQRVQALSDQLLEAQSAFRQVQEVELPAAMLALGMKSLKLAKGASIDIKHEYHAAIPEARREEAYEWLRDNDLDHIIKRTLSVKFGKGEDAVADKVSKQLKKLLPDDAQFTDRPEIHPQTLKAFVKEMIETGTVALPRDVFGVHEIDRAILKTK